MNTSTSGVGRRGCWAFVLGVMWIGHGAARGQSTVWEGGGSWFDSSRWSNGTPSGNTAALIKSGAPNVFMPGAASAQLLVEGGVNVGSDAMTPGVAGTLSTAAFVVGYTGAGSASVAAGGRVNSTSVDISFYPGSSGFAQVDGTPALVPPASGDPQPATWNNSGLFTVGGNGFGIANGTLSIVNGGIVNTADSLIGGGVSSGTVTVDQASQWNNSNVVRIGHGGPGLVIISNDSVLTDASALVGVGYTNPALNGNSRGDVTLSHSTWTNSFELHVGNLTTGVVTASNGATITSQRGYLGDEIGSDGTVDLSNSTWTSSIGLSVGYHGRGKLIIRSGSTVSSGTGSIGTYAEGDGTVTVDRGLWNNSQDLIVGEGIPAGAATGKGLLTIKNGGQVISRSGEIGRFSQSTGEVRVQGGFNGVESSWTMPAHDLLIGSFGFGTLTVEDGGRVTCATTWVSTNNGSKGVLDLVGTNGSRGVLETGQLLSGTGSNGTINFNGGILRATQDQPLFMRLFTPGNLVINSGGATIDSNGHNIGIDLPMQGAGGLTKAGAGTLTLDGIQAYGGLTTVDAGKLLVNGSVAGDAQVNGGATLGGSGKVTGKVTVAPGGILSPGNSPGTLTVGALELGDQSVLDIELGAFSDKLIVNGNVTLDGTVNFIGDPAFFAAGDLPAFITYSGTLINNGMVIGSVPGGLDASQFALDFSTPGVIGVINVVPEPGLGGLMILMGTLAARRRRRRRNPSADAGAVR